MIPARPLIILPLLAAAACANVQAPSGGPADKQPPRLVEQSTPDKSLSTKPQRIVFSFDEWLRNAPARDLVFVSPAVRYNAEIDGKELIVSFPDPLPDNTTVALTVGTDLADEAGNTLPAPLSTSFSTGTSLDSSAIAVKVWDANPAGVLVYLWRIDVINPDTLNYTQTPARWISQVGANGEALFSALPNGVFRVAAVRDEQKNGTIDNNRDPYGFASYDPASSLPSQTLSPVNLRTGPAKDTIPPAVIDARALSLSLLEVRFSESVDSSRLTTRSVVITDSASGAVVPVQGLIRKPNTPSTVVLATGTPLSDASTWKISASVADSAGNASNAATQKNVRRTTIPDTVRPEILGLPKDSSSIAANTPLTLVLSQPMANTPADFLSAKDSSGNAIPIQIESPFPHIIRLSLNTAYTGSITLSARLTNARSALNVAAADTNYTAFLRLTSEAKARSKVSGSLAVENPDPEASYIVALLTPEQKEVHRTTLPAAGTWTIENVPVGTYSVLCWEDTNKNGIHDTGSHTPFLYSERFVLQPKRIEVRSRWNIDNVEITLPKQ